MNRLKIIVTVLTAIVVSGTFVGARAQTENGIDPDALIDRILLVEQRQCESIKDIVFDAEYIEGEDKDGEFREKVRFVKKVFVKYMADTALYHEDYLEYYKDGELKKDKDRDNEAKSRKEKKQKRKTRDISFSMLEPFHADQREYYDISYEGVTNDRVDSYICHHFKVASIEEIEGRINGDFFFEAETFNLVRVDFSPAKLVKKVMFRMKEMAMTISYGPTEDGYWLPHQFEISGKGKAMFFIGVKFAGVEYYRNPVVNGGIEDEIFEVKNGE